MSASPRLEAACVVAAGGVSALGLGRDAWTPGELGQPAASAIRHDERLAQAGFVRPQLARAPSDLGAPAGADRATDLLRAAFRQLARNLDALCLR